MIDNNTTVFTTIILGFLVDLFEFKNDGME